MHQVTGIGGVFFRAENPKALAAWYLEHLGVGALAGRDGWWWQQEGPTVWAPFSSDTTYFGRMTQQCMINFRVRNLDATLAHLRDAGARVDPKIDEHEYGRFGWATDPESNRFELWQPTRDEPWSPASE